MKLNRKELIEKIKILNILAPKSIQTILGGIKLETAGTQVKLTGTNLETYIEFCIDHATEMPIEAEKGLVSCTELLKLVFQSLF